MGASLCGTGKPFGFSELGWSSLEAFGGEEAQADFIRQLVNRLTTTRGIDLELLGWAWLSAVDEGDAIALIRRDGSPRPAYAAWQQLFQSGR